MKKYLLFTVALILAFGSHSQNLVPENRQHSKDVHQLTKENLFNPESGFLLDSSLNYAWESSISNWSTYPNYRILNQYNNEGNPITYTDYTWNTLTNAWDYSSRIIEVYDVNGNMTEWIYDEWDEGTSSWQPYEHDSLKYNSANVLIEEAWNYYNKLNHTWFTGYLYRYNGAGVLIEFYYLYWDYQTYNIEEGFRTLNTLNTQNDPVESVSQEYDTISEGWINSSRVLYYYSSEKLVKETFDYWDGSAWMLTSQRLYTYSNNLVSEAVDQYWNSGTSSWINSTKLMYTYNSNSYVTEEVQQQWTGGAWNNYSKRTYQYNSNNDITELRRLVWTGTAWADSYLRVTVYDVNGNRIEYYYKSYDTSTGLVNYGYHYLYVFNSNNLNTETRYQIWNSQISDWENVEKDKMYYSNHIYGIPEKEGKTCKCYLKNPYVMGEPINCPSLERGKLYECTVYSMNGSMVLHDNFMGGESIRINGHLSDGAYLISISDQGKVVYKNKVIIAGNK